MQASNLPSKVLLPFADSGTKNTIPLASQIGITPGAASLTDGFPPLTFTPLASGGVPPAGADFNGVLNLITAVQQWQSAGGIFKYDSAFSTSVGGYPKGAILQSSDGSTQWLCLADNNATDPDGATPANWVSASAYGIGAVTGLTNVNVTLTPAQYGKPIITLAGALTGNVQIILPANYQEWLVANGTSGAYTATCKTAAGTGIAVPQGGEMRIRGDGTNIIAAGGYGVTPTTGDRSQKLATTQMFADEFSRSLGVAGFQRLPSGLIIQWSVFVATSAGASIAFPIAFPSTCYSLALSDNGAASSYIWTNGISATGFTGLSSTPSAQSSYIAIGI